MKTYSHTDIVANKAGAYGGIALTQLESISVDSLDKLAFVLTKFKSSELSTKEVEERLKLHGRATFYTGNRNFCKRALESIKKDKRNFDKQPLVTASNIVNKEFNIEWLKNFEELIEIINDKKFQKNNKFRKAKCVRRPQEFLKSPMLFDAETAFKVVQAARIVFEAVKASQIPSPKSSNSSKKPKRDIILSGKVSLDRSRSKNKSSSTPQIRMSSSFRTLSFKPLSKASISKSKDGVSSSKSKASSKSDVEDATYSNKISSSVVHIKEDFLRSLIESNTPYLLSYFKKFKEQKPEFSPEKRSYQRITRSFAFYFFHELNLTSDTDNDTDNDTDSDSVGSTDSESEGDDASFENRVQPFKAQPSNSDSAYKKFATKCVSRFKERFAIRNVPKNIDLNTLDASLNSLYMEYALRSLFQVIQLLCNISFLDNDAAHVAAAETLLTTYEQDYRPSPDHKKGEKVLFYEKCFQKSREMITKAKKLHENYNSKWQDNIERLFNNRSSYNKFWRYPLFFNAMKMYQDALEEKS